MKKPKKSSGRSFLIIGGLVGLLAIAIVLYVLFFTRAAGGTFSEDFSGTTYKDGTTTAQWGSGQAVLGTASLAKTVVATSTVQYEMVSDIIASSGKTIVVYVKSVSSQKDIFATLYNSSGESLCIDGTLFSDGGCADDSNNANGIEPEFRVNATGSTGAQDQPSVKFDSAGNFIIAWRSNPSQGVYNSVGKKYSSTGSVVFDETDWITSSGGLPQIGVGASDEIYVCSLAGIAEINGTTGVPDYGTMPDGFNCSKLGVRSDGKVIVLGKGSDNNNILLGVFDETTLNIIGSTQTFDVDTNDADVSTVLGPDSMALDSNDRIFITYRGNGKVRGLMFVDTDADLTYNQLNQADGVNTIIAGNIYALATSAATATVKAITGASAGFATWVWLAGENMQYLAYSSDGSQTVGPTNISMTADHKAVSTDSSGNWYVFYGDSGEAMSLQKYTSSLSALFTGYSTSSFALSSDISGADSNITSATLTATTSGTSSGATVTYQMYGDNLVSDYTLSYIAGSSVDESSNFGDSEVLGSGIISQSFTPTYDVTFTTLKIYVAINGNLVSGGFLAFIYEGEPSDTALYQSTTVGAVENGGYYDATFSDFSSDIVLTGGTTYSFIIAGADTGSGAGEGDLRYSTNNAVTSGQMGRSTDGGVTFPVTNANYDLDFEFGPAQDITNGLQTVVSGGTATFTTPTNELYWKATLTTNDQTVTPTLSNIAINYTMFQPTNSTPANAGTETTATPTLTASAYADSGLPSGSTHLASQWRISSTSADYGSPVCSSGTDTTNLVSFEVSEANCASAYTALENGTYYWQVRYEDNNSNWSNWSSETSFDVSVSSGGRRRQSVSQSSDQPSETQSQQNTLSPANTVLETQDGSDALVAINNEPGFGRRGGGGTDIETILTVDGLIDYQLYKGQLIIPFGKGTVNNTKIQDNSKEDVSDKCITQEYTASITLGCRTQYMFSKIVNWDIQKKIAGVFSTPGTYMMEIAMNTKDITNLKNIKLVLSGINLGGSLTDEILSLDEVPSERGSAKISVFKAPLVISGKDVRKNIKLYITNDNESVNLAEILIYKTNDSKQIMSNRLWSGFIQSTSSNVQVYPLNLLPDDVQKTPLSKLQLILDGTALTRPLSTKGGLLQIQGLSTSLIEGKKLEIRIKE